MSQENTTLAEGINLSDATVLLPALDLAAILQEVRDLKAELVAFKKTHNTFAVRTTNEIDEIFAKLEKNSGKNQTGKKQEARLNRLEALLVARQNEPMTFSEIGKFLELGHRNGKTTTRRQNMTILGRFILADDRFHVFNSTTQKGSKMVCLDKRYFEGGKGV